MAFRPATGRKIKVDKNPRSVRALMRRHLREEGKRMIDLAPVWDMHENSLYRRFYDNRPFPPQYVTQFVKFLQLDEFDAFELHAQAAREHGFELGTCEPVFEVKK